MDCLGDARFCDDDSDDAAADREGEEGEATKEPTDPVYLASSSLIPSAPTSEPVESFEGFAL